MPTIKRSILIAALLFPCIGQIAAAQTAGGGDRTDQASRTQRHAPDMRQHTQTKMPSSNAPFENQLKKFSAPLSANGAK